MRLLTETRPTTDIRLVGPTPLHLVVPAPDATVAFTGGLLGDASRHPEVVDLTAIREDPGASVRALTDCVVLHGWLPSRAVATLLALLDLPTTLRVRAAVEHAARSTDLTAPGSAALCGLARALLSTYASRHRIAHDVADRARRLTAGLDPFPVNGSAASLHAVVALAAQRPDDPAIVAPLFLRQHWLRAGHALHVTGQVPLMVISGELELLAAPGDQVLTAPTTAAHPGAAATLQRMADLLVPAPPSPSAPRPAPAA